MFRANIKLNEAVDVSVETALLRKKAERGRLSGAAVDGLIENFTAVVTPLVEFGSVDAITRQQLQRNPNHQRQGL